MYRLIHHYHISILLTVCIFPATGLGQIDAPRNPSSAKECALCHYRWVDTFFLHGKGSELVPYQSEKVVATAEMCFSCHDGSVADSRARVYNDRHHPINKPPPEHMEIPSIFPLDQDGNMQCATCHTAHGVPSEMGIEKTIFIRTSNENSAMCKQCHGDKMGGPKSGNHPIDTTAIPFTSKLKRLGAVEGSRKNQIICESCHRVHGAVNDKFLIDAPNQEGNLCLDCHEQKRTILGSFHDLRFSAPNTTNIRGKTPAESGVCGTCHLVHGSKTLKLWAQEQPAKSTGNKNIDLCISCHDTGKIADKAKLSGYSHPINTKLNNTRLNANLPFYSPLGDKISSTRGFITCLTCHDPHIGNSQTTNISQGVNEKFLRLPIKPSPILCSQCHANQSLVESTKHDLFAAKIDFVNRRGKSPSESGTCGVCHLIHNSDNKELTALPDIENVNDFIKKICLFCHSSNGPAHNKVLGKRNHPVNVQYKGDDLSIRLPLFKASGKKERKKKVMCLTCHSPHQWDPAINSVAKSIGTEGDGTNSFLRQKSAPDPILCRNCHTQQSFIWKTDHDMNVVAPESANLLGQSPSESGTCGACHLVHNGKMRFNLWARKLRKGNGLLDKMCKSCHRKKDIARNKVPKADSHPDGMLITNVGRDKPQEANYFPLYHKRTGRKLQVGDISCASCHNVHQWDPLINRHGEGKNIEGKTTNSFLRRQTYSIMCIDCHGLDALFRFKYYHNSKQRGPVIN